MNVEINKLFPLEKDTDSAWQLLSNVEAVALCMPGAEITEVVDENHYKGKVRVKLGPVNMEFGGDINVQSIDEGKKQIHLICEGKDNKGTSSASMDLTAHVADAADTASQLAGDAKVEVNGKLANFGQRMMVQVADQILEQFADNFREQLGFLSNESVSTGAPIQNEHSGSDSGASASVGSAVTSVTSQATDAQSAETHSATAQSTAAQSATAQPTSVQSTTTRTASSKGNEINGFSFAIKALFGVIAGFFKRK